MMFKELFAFSFILCQVLGYKLQCTRVEEDILRKKNGKLYIMHSFSKINNHSFDEDPKNVFYLPLTYQSTKLMNIVEYSDSFHYSSQIQSTKYNTLFDFKAMKLVVKNETKEYCGFKQTLTYFVLVLKANRPKEELNSIILYGCDILTSGHITVLIIERENFSITSDSVDVLLQNHKITNFPLHGHVNRGFCMCPLSRQYITNCIETQKQRSFNNNMFWIVIGVVIIFIILVFALNY